MEGNKLGRGGLNCELGFVVDDEDFDYASCMLRVFACLEGLESGEGVVEGVGVADEVFDAAHLLCEAFAFGCVRVGGVGVGLCVYAAAVGTKCSTCEEADGDGVGVGVTEYADDVDLAEACGADGECLDGVSHADQDRLSSGLCCEDAGLHARWHTRAFEDNVETFGLEVHGSRLHSVSGVHGRRSGARGREGLEEALSRSRGG